MSRSSGRRAMVRRNAVGAILVLAVAGAAVVAGAPPGGAQEAALVVTTPYTGVVVQPGSSVQLDLDVTAPNPQPVGLSVAAPDGWSTVLRGGGFVITGVTAGPEQPGSAQLEIDVPPDVEAGRHEVVVTAAGSGGQSRLSITLTVQAEVDSGIEVTADFPSLRGGPQDTFSYTLTIANNTPEEQSFNFAPQGPSGWEVTASPQAEQRANTVTIEAGSTANVAVEAIPAASTPAGQYPIRVDVTAANGARGAIELTADVSGTAQLEIATADGQLNADGQAGDTTTETILVANTGTAPLEEVRLASTPPADWEVTFEPESVPAVAPGETTQLQAHIRPPSDAVAGDYVVGIQASSGSNSSSLELRYSVETSSLVGLIAALVIAAAIVVLVVVYRRFGRR